VANATREGEKKLKNQLPPWEWRLGGNAQSKPGKRFNNMQRMKKQKPVETTLQGSAISDILCVKKFVGRENAMGE